eukprot:TRINITY_DN4977_c0_g5_i1.p1 TRINITY_DN4977_c0_g5~~TRINITY_DN4977_c0_g5_i1.p1  ORF type:complete len:394 (+),score=91.73 TRINITY_DN4977_c0_g5_i1:55-1236(+)
MTDLPALHKDDKANRMLSALKGANRHETVPIWAMRQAGRYLPEYMKFTEGTEFFHNCQTPERAEEITVQPVRLDIDAAILFSDILIVPQAMGMIVRMCPGKGPQFDAPMNVCGDISSLIDGLSKTFSKEQIDKSAELVHAPSEQIGATLVESLAYTKTALNRIRKNLDGKIPLIGFTGAPWTLMCYMTEGSSKPSYAGARRWFFETPNEAKKLLRLITNTCLEVLLQQIGAGAQIIQLFESHGGEITPECFMEFELPCLDFIAKTIKKLHPEIPVILFARNCLHSLEPIFASSFDAVSIDCNTSITVACELAKKYGKAVQGNLDPCVLYASEEVITTTTHKMLADVAAVMGTTPSGAPASYVANLGWGMLPTHKPEKLQAFINAVHSFTQKKN